jgi:hypothetical protein
MFPLVRERHDRIVEKASGDFMLETDQQTTVLIRAKDYANNVPERRDRQVYPDVAQQKCSSFLSQSSGISLKENYQIGIQQRAQSSSISHNCDYAPERIKIAVDIIDSNNR